MAPITATEAALRHRMIKQIVDRARSRNEEFKQHQDAYAAYKLEVLEQMRALFRGER